MIEVNKDRAEADQGLNQDHQNFSEEDVSRFIEFSKSPTLYDELLYISYDSYKLDSVLL